MICLSKSLHYLGRNSFDPLCSWPFLSVKAFRHKHSLFFISQMFSMICFSFFLFIFMKPFYYFSLNLFLCALHSAKWVQSYHRNIDISPATSRFSWIAFFTCYPIEYVNQVTRFVNCTCACMCSCIYQKTKQ